MHYVLKQTATFRKWREGLRDPKLKAILASRLDRLAFGLEGDTKRVAPHIYELRIHYGAGIRVYFLRQGNTWIIRIHSPRATYLGGMNWARYCAYGDVTDGSSGIWASA
ncbi:MAG: type II toxin-antitoxin system RelE/ParE family toxin [Hyphomonadaceae bacterium]|jgi:putative addiction module killer protein